MFALIPCVSRGSRCLHELDCPHYPYEIIMRFVMRAIDFGPRECELVSQMINCLVGDEFSDTDIIKAFEKLLQRIADWKLDVPNVEEVCAVLDLSNR